MVFSYAEDDSYRLKLCNNNNSVCVPCMDNVSGIDQAKTNPTSEWRFDGAILQIYFRGLNLGFIDFQGSFVLMNCCLLDIQCLFGNSVPGICFLISRQVYVGLVERRLVALVLTFGLKQLRLKQARIDLGQNIALVNKFA